MHHAHAHRAADDIADVHIRGRAVSMHSKDTERIQNDSMVLSTFLALFVAVLIVTVYFLLRDYPSLP